MIVRYKGLHCIAPSNVDSNIIFVYRIQATEWILMDQFLLILKMMVLSLSHYNVP